MERPKKRQQKMIFLWVFFSSIAYADFQVNKLFCVASFVVILGHRIAKKIRNKKQIVFRCIIYDPKSKNLINIQTSESESVSSRELCA